MTIQINNNNLISYNYDVTNLEFIKNLRGFRTNLNI